jgi:hypothetical protein
MAGLILKFKTWRFGWYCRRVRRQLLLELADAEIATLRSCREA